jgi:hypothetical protein
MRTLVAFSIECVGRIGEVGMFGVGEVVVCSD